MTTKKIFSAEKIKYQYGNNCHRQDHDFFVCIHFGDNINDHALVEDLTEKQADIIVKRLTNYKEQKHA